MDNERDHSAYRVPCVLSRGRMPELLPEVTVGRRGWIRMLLPAGCAFGLAVTCAVGSEPPGVARVKVDEAWDDVLALGRDGGSGARRELQQIAARNDGVPSTALARKMLSLWSEAASAMHSDTPQALVHPRLSPDALRRILPGTQPAGLVIVEVSVDSRGFVTRATVLRGAPSSEVEALILDTTRSMLFCPAKVSADYAPGKVTLTFSLEVR